MRACATDAPLGQRARLRSIYAVIADWWAIADALALRARAAQLGGDLDLAEEIANESLEFRQAIEDRWGAAEMFSLQGAIARARGKEDDAAALYARSREIYLAVGYRRGAEECDRVLAGIRQALPT